MTSRSRVTNQKYRPASLQLQSIPTAIHSSPDGSCLFTSHATGSETSFTAYHWGTFGSTPGISLGSLGLSATNPWVLTSFNRRSIHLMSLDAVNHQCQSIALDITRKITEFMFKAKGRSNSPRNQSISTMHNCLIECHTEVWTSLSRAASCAPSNHFIFKHETAK